MCGRGEVESLHGSFQHVELLAPRDAAGLSSASPLEVVFGRLIVWDRFSPTSSDAAWWCSFLFVVALFDFRFLLLFFFELGSPVLSCPGIIGTAVDKQLLWLPTGATSAIGGSSGKGGNCPLSLSQGADLPVGLLAILLVQI